MNTEREDPDRSEWHKHFAIEYEQINENIRSLADIRFKLLALIPPLGGVAVFVLSHLGLTADVQKERSAYILVLVFMASVFWLACHTRYNIV